MAKLHSYNGRYCESEYENAFLTFLEAEGWQYLAGNSIVRNSRREVLYADDLEFLASLQGQPRQYVFWPGCAGAVVLEKRILFNRIDRPAVRAEGLPARKLVVVGK